MRADRFVFVFLLAMGCDDTPSTSDASADVTYYQGGDGNVYAWNDAAGACQPSSTASFAPVKIAPVVNHACTDAQIASYVAACLDPSLPDRTACDAWKAISENQACITSCPVVTDIKAASWGTFVEFTNPGTFEVVNIGACVALEDPSPAGQACADAINAQLECEYFTCASNCSIPTLDVADASTIVNAEIAYIECTYAAGSGPCASYVDASIACVAALPPNAPEKFCVDGTLLSRDPSTYDPAITKVLGAQCGGAISDAGADGD